MVDFVNNVRSFVNYAIFCELCDQMRSEVDCVKSYHRVISEGLPYGDLVGASQNKRTQINSSRYDVLSVIGTVLLFACLLVCLFFYK